MYAELIAVLREMVNAEKTVAEFYMACAVAFPSHRDFWKALSLEELNHAEALAEVAGAVEKHPEDFTPNLTLRLPAIKTFIAGLAQNTEKVANGSLDIGKAFFIANDLEKALIELRYGEVVKSKNPRYQEILNRLAEDEKKHRLNLTTHIPK